MQPGPIELLNGIKQIIGNALLGELQTETARAQAMYVIVLIDHLIARWDIEGPLLVEERAELRALLTRAAAALRDHSALTAQIRATLEAPESSSASALALSTETRRMRSLVPAIAPVVAKADKQEPVRELADLLHMYIRNQHRRDLQLVQVGALGW